MKSSKNYKEPPAQQTCLCSVVKAFVPRYLLRIRLLYIFHRAASDQVCVCLKVELERTMTPNKHIMSGSNQITTPGREVSHGTSVAVSLALGLVVRPRREGFLKNSDYIIVTFSSHGNSGAVPPKTTQRTLELELER